MLLELPCVAESVGAPTPLVDSDRTERCWQGSSSTSLSSYYATLLSTSNSYTFASAFF